LVNLTSAGISWNPGVSSMIVCVPQDFKWFATQPFERIVSSFFTLKQEVPKKVGTKKKFAKRQSGLN
jgi:hypothetical protein